MVRLFGSTIKETVNAFSNVHLGGDNKEAGTSEDRIKAIGRIIVSVIMIFLATYLFTTGKDSNTAIAGTIVGAIVGYWIK